MSRRGRGNRSIKRSDGRESRPDDFLPSVDVAVAEIAKPGRCAEGSVSPKSLEPIRC